MKNKIFIFFIMIIGMMMFGGEAYANGTATCGRCGSLATYTAVAGASTWHYKSCPCSNNQTVQESHTSPCGLCKYGQSSGSGSTTGPSIGTLSASCGSYSNSTSVTFTVNGVAKGSGTISKVCMWIKTAGASDWNLLAAANMTASSSSTYTYSYTFPGEGTYTIVSAVKDSNNLQAVSNEIQVIVDTTVPTGTVTFSTYNTKTGKVTATVTGTDNLSGISFYEFPKWNVSTGTTPDWSQRLSAESGSLEIDLTTISGGAEGTYAVHVYATDKAGNRGAISGSANSIKIDKTAPSGGTATIPTYTTTGKVTVSATATDASSGIAYFEFPKWKPGTTNPDWSTVATATSNACSNVVVDLTGIASNTEGTYAIHAYATDKAGNRAGISGGKEVIYDKTGPTVSSITASATVTNQNTVTIIVDASDSLAGVADSFTINGWYGSSYVNHCTGATATKDTDGKYKATFTFANIKNTSTGATSNGDGVYMFDAHVTDKAGNKTISNAVQVRLDKTVPTVNSYELSAVATNNGTVTATINASDNLSGVSKVVFYACIGDMGGYWRTVKIVTSENGIYSATYNFSEIVDATTNTATGANGVYYIDAIVHDNAGNEYYQSPLSVIYDTVSPISAGTVIDTPSYTNTMSGGTFRVSVTNPQDNVGGSGIGGLKIKVSSDGQTWNVVSNGDLIESNGTWYYDVPVTDEGTYYYEMYPIDKAGNVDTTWNANVSGNVKIDRTDPTSYGTLVNTPEYSNTASGGTIRVTIENPTDNTGGSGIEGVRLYVSNNGKASWNVLEDVGMTKNGTQYYYDIPITIEGTYDMLFHVYDKAGNWLNVSNDSIIIDRTAI